MRKKPARRITSSGAAPTSVPQSELRKGSCMESPGNSGFRIRIFSPFHAISEQDDRFYRTQSNEIERGSAEPTTQEWLRPVTAVERSILNGFGQVTYRQVLRALKVRNRPRHFQDAVVRACRQSLLLHRPL